MSEELNLVTVLTTVLHTEIKAEHLKEIKEKQYKPQAAFSTCKERASSLMHPAINRATNMYALAILNHREAEHGEDHSKEKAELLAVISEEDIELVKTRGWWNF